MNSTSSTNANVSGAKPRQKRIGAVRRILNDVVFVARRDRRLILLPLAMLLLLLAALIVLGTSLGPLAPFIYPLF